MAEMLTEEKLRQFCCSVSPPAPMDYIGLIPIFP